MPTTASPRALRERPARYGTAGHPGRETPPEQALVALWLLGRVPAALLPWPLLRAGRAGRGPGPDVREAAFAGPAGVPLCGDVEVHLRASDFVRHGHLRDPAYDAVVLHLVWEDDRPRDAGQSRPQPLPGGGSAPTVEVAPALGRDAPARLRTLERLLRRGPALGVEPCAFAARRDPAAAAAAVRAEGRRRLAERTWRASALAAEHGWPGAWRLLLLRALAASAGRRREAPDAQGVRAARIDAALGPMPLRRLAGLAAGGRPAPLVEALAAAGGIGRGRAAELGWNAALPLLAALAAAYDDLDLARATAALADRWPAPRPYGRTRALAGCLPPAGGGPARGGALHAQGLLHLQELWCERGGCGACPLSPADEGSLSP